MHLSPYKIMNVQQSKYEEKADCTIKRCTCVKTKV